MSELMYLRDPESPTLEAATAPVLAFRLGLATRAGLVEFEVAAEWAAILGESSGSPRVVEYVRKKLSALCDRHQGIRDVLNGGAR